MKNKLKPGRDYLGVGGGVLIMNDKNEVLLKKRSGKSKNDIGAWERPGGTVEYGEKAETSMLREAKEELGINIKIIGYFPHTDHFLKKDKEHWIGLSFLGVIKSGKPKNMEPHKCDEIGWFHIEKLPKNLAQPTRESIDNYLAGRYIKINEKRNHRKN